MKFACQSCGHVVAEYIGKAPLVAETILLSSQWLINGKQPEYGSRREVVCPKCGARVLRMQDLVPVKT